MPMTTLAALLAVSLLAASPPVNTTTARHGAITCAAAQLYVWPRGSSLPRASVRNRVHIGQTFDVLDGPRSTLSGVPYFELELPVVEVGAPPGSRYWIMQRCVNVHA